MGWRRRSSTLRRKVVRDRRRGRRKVEKAQDGLAAIPKTSDWDQSSENDDQLLRATNEASLTTPVKELDETLCTHSSDSSVTTAETSTDDSSCGSPVSPSTSITFSLPADATDGFAIWSVLESKRRCWFVSEVETLEHHTASLHWMLDDFQTWSQTLPGQLDCQTWQDYSKQLTTIREEFEPASNGLASACSSSWVRPILQALSQAEDELTSHLPGLLEFAVSGRILCATLAVRHKELQARLGLLPWKRVQEAEEGIQNAWEALFEVSEELMRLESRDNCKYTMSSLAKGDRWLLEVNYSNAMTAFVAEWKHLNVELKSLAHDISTFDHEARFQFKALLLNFLPRRRRLVMRIQEIFDLVALPICDQICQQSVDRDIEEAIEKLSRSRLRRSYSHRSSILNRSQSSARFHAGLEEMMHPEKPDMSPFHVDPFSSIHILESHVMSVRLLPDKECNLAIGVVTDQYLHVYETQFPSDDTMDISRISVNDLGAAVPTGATPTISMVWSRCEFLVTKQQHVRVFDKDAARLFFKRRHVFDFRLATREIALEWVERRRATVSSL